MREGVPQCVGIRAPPTHEEDGSPMQLLSTPRPLTRRSAVRWLAALCCAVLPVLGAATRSPAASAAAAEVVGNATYFDGLGTPVRRLRTAAGEAGHAGLRRAQRLQHTRRLRLLPPAAAGANVGKIGMWNNGLNCGRWVQVDDRRLLHRHQRRRAEPAVLPQRLLGRRRVQRRHADHARRRQLRRLQRLVPRRPLPPGPVQGLAQPVREGRRPGRRPVPDHWNNRHVSWSFIPAPDYSGDIKIGFLQGAQRWWPAISVSHLANGIHGVEYFAERRLADGADEQRHGPVLHHRRDGLRPSSFTIRVRDASDA